MVNQAGDFLLAAVSNSQVFGQQVTDGLRSLFAGGVDRAQGFFVACQPRRAGGARWRLLV